MKVNMKTETEMKTKIVHHVDSTAVACLAYRGETRELSVWFTSNPDAEYVYVNVPLFMVGAIFRSKSKGKAINKHVVGKAEFIKNLMQKEKDSCSP